MKQNILQYIREFGDYAWEERGVSLADFLVLAQLTYLKYKNYIPGMQKYRRGVTLRQLLQHPGYYAMFEEEWLSSLNHQLFLEAATSVRFGAVELKYYAEICDSKRNIGFSAVVYVLSKHRICISYRGTDEALAGWIENSRLAFDAVIPGQELAAAYLRMVYALEGRIDYVIGHSKGGNLCEYAISESSPELLKNIKLALNLDGPGQRFHRPKLGASRRIYRKIVPKESVIGMLYEDYNLVQLVDCYGFGMLQHNLYEWKIIAGKLRRIKKTRLRGCYLHLLTRCLLKGKIKQQEKWICWLIQGMKRSGAENLFVWWQRWQLWKS